MLSATVTHSVESFVAFDCVKLRGHECGCFCKFATLVSVSLTCKLRSKSKGCGVLAAAVASMAINQCEQPQDEHGTMAPKELQRRVDLQPKRSGAETYSLASVAKHNKPNDCWVIIRDKVYNVTAWVPQHPGGALIYINAGKDCTQLFDSYHPLYVRYALCTYQLYEVS